MRGNIIGRNIPGMDNPSGIDIDAEKKALLEAYKAVAKFRNKKINDIITNKELGLAARLPLLESLALTLPGGNTKTRITGSYESYAEHRP